MCISSARSQPCIRKKNPEKLGEKVVKSWFFAQTGDNSVFFTHCLFAVYTKKKTTVENV